MKSKTVINTAANFKEPMKNL